MLVSQLKFNQVAASLNASSIWLVSKLYLTIGYDKLDTVVCYSLRHTSGLNLKQRLL